MTRTTRVPPGQDSSLRGSRPVLSSTHGSVPTPCGALPCLCQSPSQRSRYPNGSIGGYPEAAGVVRYGGRPGKSVNDTRPWCPPHRGRVLLHNEAPAHAAIRSVLPQTARTSNSSAHAGRKPAVTRVCTLPRFNERPHLPQTACGAASGRDAARHANSCDGCGRAQVKMANTPNTKA